MGAVYGGRSPYPWQQRFAERCASGLPPSTVGVPTGCGKTTVVDALVWALALRADLPPAERRVGARIVWAIDRRILVDEVHAHASAVAERLLIARDQAEDPLHETAVRLSGMSGDVPLVATRWRGGIATDRSLHPPTQPQVITSTVAQVGSRLLFRGYGVGRRSLSIEAGLAACDTTICLDEAHLTEPFRQTVSAIRARRADTEGELALPGLGLLTMTATPGEHLPDDAVLLEADDLEEPELKRRLEAEKWARVEESPSTERERVSLIAEKAAAHLADGAPTVACVVNNVRRARAVFALLKREVRDDDVDLALLVGPQRPADRDLLLREHGDLLFGRRSSERPLVCVATQTFEVGLDADVAAMVTDSASASALVQRLGRLNRGGHATGQATIVRDPDTWLYEADEPLAWEWLKSLRGADGSVDVSVVALEADRSRPLPIRKRSAPSLTPAILDLLVQTNPQPGRWQEPDVEVFLRGAEEQTTPDVTVCWRCDLLPGVDDPAAQGYREMLLELVPPQAQEQLTLSVKAARALVAARYSPEAKTGKATTIALSDSDVEGETEPARVPEPQSLNLAVPFLVVRRGETLHGTTLATEDAKVTPGSLQPGDVVVLPTQAGGVDQHGLAPAGPRHSTEAAELNDVAGDRRPRPAKDQQLPDLVPVRLSPAALGEGNLAEWPQVRMKCRRVTDGITPGDREGSVADLIGKLARMLPDHDALSLLTPESLAEREEPIRVLLRAIGPVGTDESPRLDEHEVEALEGEGPEETGAEGDGTAEEVPEDIGAAPRPSDLLERTWVLIPVTDRERERRRRDGADPPPTITAHATAVRSQVEEFVADSGLPSSIRSALSLAAAGHDHGKADPRTQAFYHGGVSPLGIEPIAKSVFGTSDPRTERLAYATAGLPQGLRHEIASVAVLSEWLASEATRNDALDADLVLHLVASHHGEGRPIPRTPSGGEEARPFHVAAAGVEGTAVGDGQDGWADGEWLRRFWRVLDRYGEWGTAYLEALLVTADRTVSGRGD